MRCAPQACAGPSAQQAPATAAALRPIQLSHTLLFATLLFPIAEARAESVSLRSELASVQSELSGLSNKLAAESSESELIRR